MKALGKFGSLAVVALVLLAYVAAVPAQNTNSKIANTKHNLSANSGNTIRAAAVSAGGTDQICVFCHTPHAANAAAPAPLWNRQVGVRTGAVAGATYTAAYTMYTSESFDAQRIADTIASEPGGASKLCLSCHDGTLAFGTVANSPGRGTTGSIAMASGVDKMPAGTDGNTRNLGVDLRNDHPISFKFTTGLASRDGELRYPPYEVSSKTVVGIRSQASKPWLPLDHEGRVQCTSCHDPHLDADRFLRLNRFQKTASPGTSFSATNDQICLGCHDKNYSASDGQGGITTYPTWGDSIHANKSLTDTYAYTSAASTARNFPANIKVWEAGCLNCHDTHTNAGARRLLRNGVSGGASAIEETCYQCHSSSPIITNTTLTATAGVPNIASEFSRARRMPITGTETHEIGGEFNDIGYADCTAPDNKCGADFIESQAKLAARHVECTDCHNPHRVIKNSLFTGGGGLQSGAAGIQRTHVAGGANGNVASGALRGAWGVEPVYSSVSTSNWPVAPGSFGVKRGDPGGNTGIARSQPYLTREYQLCFKCHSNYGFGTPPATGYTGGTPGTTNSFGSSYTNIAAEFGVNATPLPEAGRDQGEFGKCSSGCPTNYTDIDPTGSAPADTTGSEMTDDTGVQNHRSWHPVTMPTGRSRAERRMANNTGGNFRAPFNSNDSTNGVGMQTMHCSDCHGPDGSWTQDTGPNLSTVQGPHGSNNNFLLRSTSASAAGTNVWSDSTAIGSPGFCGNCHNPTAGTEGTGDSGSGRTSGFNANATDSSGGHGNAHAGRECMNCHVAVPHGWKNKALLVNLNCVGEEVGLTTCNAVTSYAYSSSNNSAYTNGPYYVTSYLRVRTWKPSGNWAASSCGRSGSTGKAWMKDSIDC